MCPNIFFDSTIGDHRRNETSIWNQIFVILKPGGISILNIFSKLRTICAMAWKSFCYKKYYYSWKSACIRIVFCKEIYDEIFLDYILFLGDQGTFAVIN